MFFCDLSRVLRWLGFELPTLASRADASSPKHHRANFWDLYLEGMHPIDSVDRSIAKQWSSQMHAGSNRAYLALEASR